MRYAAISALMLGFAVLAACQQTGSTDDPEKLKQVVINYFDGIRNNDRKKMIEVTTDDFFLYEMGKVWNNDSVFRNMDQNLPYRVEFKFDNFQINVDYNSGNLAYYGHADFVFNDTTKQSLSFVESAALKKINGEWKINFLHITRRD